MKGELEEMVRIAERLLQLHSTRELGEGGCRYLVRSRNFTNYVIKSNERKKNQSKNLLRDCRLEPSLAKLAAYITRMSASIRADSREIRRQRVLR